MVTLIELTEEDKDLALLVGGEFPKILCRTKEAYWDMRAKLGKAKFLHLEGARYEKFGLVFDLVQAKGEENV